MRIFTSKSTITTIIVVRKCTICCTRILSLKTIKMSVCIVRATWGCIGRWISRIVGVTGIIVCGNRSFVCPPIVFTFFIKKFKCKKEYNYNRHCSCAIQVKLPNEVSRKTRNPKRHKNRQENPRKDFFEYGRFSRCIFGTFIFSHKIFSNFITFSISKILPINQENMA